MKALEAEKIEKETIRKLGVSRQHHVSLEEYKSKAELESIKYYQTIYLTTSGKKRPALSTQAVVE